MDSSSCLNAMFSSLALRRAQPQRLNVARIILEAESLRQSVKEQEYSPTSSFDVLMTLSLVSETVMRRFLTHGTSRQSIGWIPGGPDLVAERGMVDP